MNFVHTLFHFYNMLTLDAQVVQRSLNRARSSWALIGLAVRIAHGFGLHRDGDGRAFSAFEAEMRRRIWWQILALDMRASEDRGSEPTLAENSSDTAMPCNLNDEDLKYDSPHPLRSRTGPTEMTLCLLNMDALRIGRMINFRSLASEPGNLTSQEREELVQKYVERVESTYLAGCDFSEQRTRLLRLMGHYYIHKLWLILYYPLQRRMPSQQVQSRSQGLQTAVTFLTVNESIEQHPSSAGFAWLFKIYVPWHAVAVVLTELCTQPQGPLADRAWEIIQNRFKDWNGRVADTKEAMLWNPIKKLLRRALAAQQQYGQELFQDRQALHPSDLDSIIQDFDASGTSNPGLQGGEGSGSSFDLQSFNDFSLLDQATMDQSLNLLPFAPENMVATSIESSTAFNNLDNWNEFMFDVNALGGEVLLEPYNI
jgi:Fungal specific transcription factor domain